MNTSLAYPVIVLITVNDNETHAVLDAFVGERQAPPQVQKGEVTYNELGIHGGSRIVHTVCEMGTGRIGASQQRTREAIEHWQPSAVIAVGIAFGLNENKQAIGDVLVSTQIQDYDLGRLNEDGTLTPRGDKPSSSHCLLNRFRQTDTNKSRLTQDWPKVRFGLILSGQKLLDNMSYRESLKALFHEAIGGEMEGVGVYGSASVAKVDWIVVKAICDWGHNKNQADKDAWQKLAAKNAAQVLRAALDVGNIYGGELSPAKTEHADKVSAYKIKLGTELKSQGHEHYIGRRAKFITMHREDGDGDDGESILRRRSSDISERAYKGDASPEEITLHHLSEEHFYEAVVFVASEGMGKTFEANRLALALTDITAKRLCVWIPCRGISDESIDSLERLWGKQLGNLRPNYDDMVTLPEEWKITLILDGFDEIVGDGCLHAFDSILEKSKAFIRKWRGIVVVTARDVDSVHNRFKKEFRYALQEFSDGDILEYLGKRNKNLWFDTLPKQDKKVVNFLRIPFFLHALAETDFDRSELSELNRAGLLDKYLDELLIREIVKNKPEWADSIPDKLKKLRAQLSQHAIGLTISGCPLEKLSGIPLEEITFLLNQQEPHTFKHDIVRHFLLALAVKEALNAGNRDLFSRIAQRAARPDGTLPLSDAVRQTIWSLLLELANNDQHQYPNTIKALCEVDPVLVCFGLKDRGRLPEEYKSPEIVEWNLFQSGLCKLLLGITDSQPEREIICDERLVSPEEVLIARLRDENLHYVATAEAIDAFRKNLLKNPEPWSDLVKALGYEIAFGWQHPLYKHEKVMRYAFGFARVGDGDGFQDFSALAKAIGDFADYLEVRTRCTLLDLDALCRTLRQVREEYFLERDNDSNKKLSQKLLSKLGGILYAKSDGFRCLTTRRQVHRLIAHDVLPRIMSSLKQDEKEGILDYLKNDEIIDYEVLVLAQKRQVQEEVKGKLQNDTKNFLEFDDMPPVKVFGVLEHFQGKGLVDSSVVKSWGRNWVNKLTSCEVGKFMRRVKCFPGDKEYECIPIAITQSHGWLRGREAAHLAESGLPIGITYSTEQKESWCRFATNKELKALLESKVVVRGDEYFRKIVSILLERSSPVFLRELLFGNQDTGKAPILQSDDIPKQVEREWLDAINERPDYDVACRKLEWLHRAVPISQKVKELVGREKTGYRPERNYYLEHGLITASD